MSETASAGVRFFEGLWRGVLIGYGIVLLVLALGFATQAPWATVFWPWPDGRLTYWVIGAILAAIGAPIIWIGASGELAAMRAGALDLALSMLGITGYLIWIYQPPAGQPPLLPYVATVSIGILANLILFLVSQNLAFRDRRPLPSLARWSFLLFAVSLIGVGGALLWQYPTIFPWPLKPESSVLMGWIFLGAAVYFLYGFFAPSWANGCGQLLGFLAYDLVLIMPLVNHLTVVKDAHQLSLFVYLAVLGYSGLLAIYFLFLHPATRFGGEQPAPALAAGSMA
ncbi:MAG: hypothetical protein U1F68_12025 [Gammaproteobacteria bacterium]